MKRDWKLFKHYDAYRRVGEHVLRRTGTGEAPWTIIEGADRRYRNLTVSRTLLEALRVRLEQVRSEPPASEPSRPLCRRRSTSSATWTWAWPSIRGLQEDCSGPRASSVCSAAGSARSNVR